MKHGNNKKKKCNTCFSFVTKFFQIKSFVAMLFSVKLVYKFAFLKCAYFFQRGTRSFYYISYLRKEIVIYTVN